MNHLTGIILLCCLLGACSNDEKPKAQENEKAQMVKKAMDTLTFPDSWLGIWAGELEIYRENKLQQKLPMELELLESDSSENYIWAIIYGEDKIAGRRPYELEILDTEKGHYRVDEKNTIKLESYLFGNKLYNWFAVMNSMILCTYELDGDELLFEIVSGSTEPVSITGNQKYEGEDIPEVKTYPVAVTQRAVLRRK